MTSTAVVTGANGGIGRAVVEELAAAGTRVIATDLNLNGSNWPDGVVGVSADLREGDQIASVFERLEGNSLDFLVNAAGIALFGEDGSSFETADSVWDRVLSVNLHGVRRVTRAALPYLRRGHGRSIVHVASLAGLRGMDSPLDAYQVSKSAVVSLSRAMALQLGPEGIRCNTVCPGAILTPMISALYDENPDRRLDMELRTPMRRLGLPKDVATAVAFLLSDRASFITATDLVVDGGWGSQLK